MASTFRGWFTSKTSATKQASNSRIKGHSYDSAIALDPPVKGSYPVAGNGPSVLESIQRSHANRDTLPSNRRSSIAEPPNVPRTREEIVDRPRTAPHDGTASGHKGRRSGSISSTWAGRTRSGFSMKSPPSFFGSSSRRNSMRSTMGEPPVPPIPSSASIPIATPVQTYQPTRPVAVGAAAAGRSDNQNPPFHSRTASHATQRSHAHVDLLEAHSAIRSSRETSQHRAKRSGVPNYGEDVADRNIDRFGAGSANHLDLDSPQFSYLKTVYSPKKRQPSPGVAASHSRASSALGHVLGSGDDTPAARSHGKPVASTPRPSTAVPPHRNSNATGSFVNHNSDRASSLTSSLRSHDRRGRVSSQLYAGAASAESLAMRDTMRSGQASAARQPQIHAVAMPPTIPDHSIKRKPALPVTNETASSSSSLEHRKSRSSASYSPYPNTPASRSGQSETTVSPPALASKRQGMVESTTPISLEGILDLTNTVDTDFFTKTLPAVTHEHVTPVQCHVREEVITREFHTHHHFTRQLPVIETEILPPIHFVKTTDGRFAELPASQIPRYTGDWEIVRKSQGQPLVHPPHVETRHDAAVAPVIGLACSTPAYDEPILAEQRQYMTNEGHSRTHYLWRHPPVFEDIHGRTQPVAIPAGMHPLRLSLDDFVSEDGEDRDNVSLRDEEDLLFRDSGYGQGMLPGLPVSDVRSNERVRGSEGGEKIVLGRVRGQDGHVESEGEATRALRRLREKRSGSSMSSDKHADPLVKEMSGMHV